MRVRDSNPDANIEVGEVLVCRSDGRFVEHERGLLVEKQLYSISAAVKLLHRTLRHQICL